MMKALKSIGAALILLASTGKISSQSILNGNFAFGGMYWGCAPEVNIETFFGGVLSLNLSNEVDALATICNTVSGLVPGNNYYLVMDASRRTGLCPSPAVTNVDITMSGGVLSASLTRTNTTFGWTPSGFLFTASSPAHTFTISAGAGLAGSCGMIIDNIVAVSAVLPMELTTFTCQVKDKLVQLNWSTAMERNNDHFEIEKSTDGTNFITVSSTGSKSKNGQSQSKLDYTSTDNSPSTGTTYYRLKQVDFNEMFSYSAVIAISYQKTRQPSFSVYPNPNPGSFELSLSEIESTMPVEVMLYDQVGGLVHSSSFPQGIGLHNVKISPQQQLKSGCYQCCLVTEGVKYFTKVIVE